MGELPLLLSLGEGEGLAGEDGTCVGGEQGGMSCYEEGEAGHKSRLQAEPSEEGLKSKGEESQHEGVSLLDPTLYLEGGQELGDV